MQKRKQRRSRVGVVRRKRKPKTLEQVLELEENELHVNPDTGIVLYMENTQQRLWTWSELLHRFYEMNHDLMPIAFALVADGAQSWAEKDWYAILYGRWHIRIVKGSETEGPHQCQLWLKSESMNQAFWIASLQLMGFFYNEEEMKTNLMEEIKQKNFFMTDEERDRTLTT